MTGWNNPYRYRDGRPQQNDQRGYRNDVPRRNYRDDGPRGFRDYGSRSYEDFGSRSSYRNDESRGFRGMDESRNFREYGDGPSYRGSRRNDMPPRRYNHDGYRNNRARQSSEAEQKTNNNDTTTTNLIKRSDWEAIMTSVNEDGGVYTSDEDNIERQHKQKIGSDTTDGVSQSASGDHVEVVVESEADSVYINLSVSMASTLDLPPSKINSDESVAELVNTTTINTNTPSSEVSKISVHPENATHLHFGIKEVSDLEITCGSHIFHVHRQLLEHFISNMTELMSGNFGDWIHMNRICEILYNQRMVDEQFLMCAKDIDKTSLFWKDGNGIMHLARKLGIPAVKNYMDRAVAFYRCNDSQKCTFCLQQRRLFATVYDLDEAKAHLQQPEPVHNLDERMFEEMLHV